MLKHGLQRIRGTRTLPAAFRRLCVETDATTGIAAGAVPAAFRRLCVETKMAWRSGRQRRPSRL